MKKSVFVMVALLLFMMSAGCGGSSSGTSATAIPDADTAMMASAVTDSIYASAAAAISDADTTTSAKVDDSLYDTVTIYGSNDNPCVIYWQYTAGTHAEGYTQCDAYTIENFLYDGVLYTYIASGRLVWQSDGTIWDSTTTFTTSEWNISINGIEYSAPATTTMTFNASTDFTTGTQTTVGTLGDFTINYTCTWAPASLVCVDNT